jgi:hypothetical protein
MNDLVSTLQNQNEHGSEAKSDLRLLTGTKRQQAWASVLRFLLELAKVSHPNPEILTLCGRILRDYGAVQVDWRNRVGSHPERYLEMGEHWYPYAMCSRTAAAARVALGRALLPIYSDWLSQHVAVDSGLDHPENFVSGISACIPWTRVVDAVKLEMAAIVRDNMSTTGGAYTRDVVQTADLTHESRTLVTSPALISAETGQKHSHALPSMITLRSSSLLSRWGFEDNELFAWVEYFGPFDPSTVLCAVVLQYLMPTLKQKVEIGFFPFGHNPVCAITVDGKDVTDLHRMGGNHEGMLTPESVEVSGAEVLALANSLHDLEPS